MTTIMNQVTYSLCNTKMDELEWMYHIVSENHLQLCENDKEKIAIKFFEMIFDTYSKQSELYNLKIKKTLDFWQSYFATKLPKEKFNLLCSDSTYKSELEDSLTQDLLNFTQNAIHDIGKSYFKSLDKITYCKLCSIEINKSLLLDHIISKEHRDIEDYFIIKCMTYCECCDKEIKNDEWRENICSEKHLVKNNSFDKYCEVCKISYSIHMDNNAHKHLESDLHKRNLFRSRYIFK